MWVFLCIAPHLSDNIFHVPAFIESIISDNHSSGREGVSLYLSPVPILTSP